MVQPFAPSAATRLAGAVWAVVRQREGSLALLLIASVLSLVQGATDNIIGIDGYYHIRVAALMREQGPRLEFPWLQLTILSPERYTDHHFLFHALQVPFTLGDTRSGAKMAAVLFATLGLYLSYLLLTRLRIRYPLVWLVILLAASQTFLWRQSMARPQGLFLALMVLALWATFAKQPLWLAPLGFAAAWLFNGFPLLLAIPLCAVGATFLLSGVARLRPSLQESWREQSQGAVRSALIGVAAASLGIALGLVAHPYFPHNIDFALLHLLPKAQVGIELDVRVGGEWYPFPLNSMPTRVGPSALLCLLGIALGLRQAVKGSLPDWRLLTVGALAVGLLGMTLRSQRIIEYSPPFAVFFGALAWSQAAPLERWPRVPWLRRLSLSALSLAAFLWLGWTVSQAQRDARGSFSWSLPRDAAIWLANNSPPGARVFTPLFDDFTRLFYWNTHNTYLVGLDPTYMTLYDPGLYYLWREVAAGRVPRPSHVIQGLFGAHYVYTERRRTEFVRAMTEDPGFEVVHSTPNTLVFRARPAP